MPLTLIQQPVAQVVKKETAVAHQETEDVLLPALQSIHSLHDYAKILKAFYGFFYPLEECIRKHVTGSLLADIDKRRNALLVRKDMAAVGFAGELPLCTSLPQIVNESQAFGALYVLEGSTLGGHMIAKMLLKNPRVEIPADGLNFFKGYKEETGKMWTIFLAELNKQQNTEAVVHTANETFYHLKKWMKEVLTYDATN
ncbi:biliverdin-producing heme oxygenase [Flavisolibacter ginsenosidimutans]|uniref:Biliverdin-producing heme oxygenase n=1 Tax=Flavisolibacter ginsenosidimutans TaxID=661481 RepID=A0A5B8UHW7_9BACT|nr:biliverdin-producing heme oxygenase [Flavisolibacter ginsenosidimutans]QEC55749.1 biliverdin-producing heme oxygenase [Flavisolibacter ginsenosidimutans]